LEDYIATLPEETAEFDEGHKFTYKLDMDGYINKIVEEQENAKKKAKFEKKMIGLFATAIVFGVPDSGKYQYLSFKKPIEFYNNDLYRNVIQTQVNQVARKYCTDGIQILNNNLKQMGITY
jgi:hypothetical protein